MAPVYYPVTHLGSWELFQLLRPHSPLCKLQLILILSILILILIPTATCCMEVDISAMMVVAALRMVEVVGEAGRPRQMSWYLGGKIFTRF